MPNKILPVCLECKPDETLVMSLGITRKNVKHEGDKGAVCRRLSKSKNHFGLVDEDPGSAQPNYLSTCKFLRRNHDVSIRIDQANNNKVIILHPKLETWIINVAKANNIRMGDFFLPDHSERLHDRINQNLPKLEKLIIKLLSIKAKEILHLKNELQQIG